MMGLGFDGYAHAIQVSALWLIAVVPMHRTSRDEDVAELL